MGVHSSIDIEADNKMGFNQLGLALILGLLFVGNSSCSKNKTKRSQRQGKLFSLFNIIQFNNDPCRSSSSAGTGNGGTRNGTCFTLNECTSKGGTVSGNCAAGFGVCCLFLLSDGGSTSQNCSYISNPNFPSPLPSSTTSGIQYTVRKCSCDVCYLRLDFMSFTIQGQSDNMELMGGMCQDSFKVTTSNGEPIPEICGQNTGQHIYVDMGRTCSGEAQLGFTFSGVSAIRQWEIKATQVECGSRSAPPDGCLQYHTDLDGRFTTFNFAPTDESHIEDQDYAICIRQEKGYCCVEYSVCPDVAESAMSLSLGGPAIAAMAYLDSDCATVDYVGIPGSGGFCSPNGATNLHSRYCGNKLNAFSLGAVHAPICDCTAPFEVRIFTDALPDKMTGNTVVSRGLCLEYTQIPCGP